MNKIIFITREGYRLPGARIRCYNFARELLNYGIDARVFSFSDTLGAKDGERESEMGLIERIKFSRRAFDRLKREKDAIFCIQRFNYHAFAPYLAHLLNKNKMIFDMDDWEMREDPKYYCGIYPSSKAHYLTCRIAARSIFCLAASRFLEEFLLPFNRKVYYIPSGVDTELFRPSSNGLPKDKIIFSWAGTLHRREYIENIGFALECFSALRRKYPGIYFEIAGDGIYRDELLKLLNKVNDAHIVYKGWLSPDSMSVYLKDIDIGLMPVVRDNKFNLSKSPTKIFEYMSMAKPTVSSAVGELSYVIRDGENGFLAAAKEEFMRKMQVLIENPELREHMGKSARQAAEREYALSVLGKRLREAIEEI